MNGRLKPLSDLFCLLPKWQPRALERFRVTEPLRGMLGEAAALLGCLYQDAAGVVVGVHVLVLGFLMPVMYEVGSLSEVPFPQKRESLGAQHFHGSKALHLSSRL